MRRIVAARYRRRAPAVCRRESHRSGCARPSLTRAFVDGSPVFPGLGMVRCALRHAGRRGCDVLLVGPLPGPAWPSHGMCARAPAPDADDACARPLPFRGHIAPPEKPNQVRRRSIQRVPPRQHTLSFCPARVERLPSICRVSRFSDPALTRPPVLSCRCLRPASRLLSCQLRSSRAPATLPSLPAVATRRDCDAGQARSVLHRRFGF